MRRLMKCRWLLSAILAAGCVLAEVGPVRGAEQARKFLDALRERRYYDMALVYLEKARANPMIAKEFKETIDYEAGVTLIRASQLARVASVRQKHLDEAQTRLASFVAKHPGNPLVSAANTQLANLMVERGRIKVEQAADPKLPPATQETFMGEARELYKEAGRLLEKQEKHFLEEHRKFPKLIPKENTEQIEAREQVRRNLFKRGWR